MARIAVLIDLGFFLARYKKLRLSPGAMPIAADVARCVWDTAKAHVTNGDDELYRILVYDCRPLAKKVHNPISKSAVDLATSHVFKFRTELHRQLVCKRKVALRLGELADRARWIIRENPTKDLLKGTKAISDLKPDDVEYDIQQRVSTSKSGSTLRQLPTSGWPIVSC